MSLRFFPALLLCTVCHAAPQLLSVIGTDSSAPSYSSDSIVNAATQLPGRFAEFTIATIYGQNLAFRTNVTNGDGASGLPTNLGGVSVYFDGSYAGLFYVSPTQINFLIPAATGTGDYAVRVIRDAAAGPEAILHLDAFSPGFFGYSSNGAAANTHLVSTIVATHIDGRLVSTDLPAAPAEILVLYATGLGATIPAQIPGRVPLKAAAISASSLIKILIDGVASDAANILYAGITPGFSGLYQINLRLPAVISSHPAVQIQFGTIISPPAKLAAVGTFPPPAAFQLQ